MKPATLYDAYLGLDIGKTKIHVCLVLNERQPKQKVMYGNNRPIWELTCLQRICYARMMINRWLERVVVELW